MATFASRELSEKVEKEEEEEKQKTETAKDVLGIVKTGPKKLTTGEVSIWILQNLINIFQSSSIFSLKNEFLKRKDRLTTTVKQTGSHVSGKSVSVSFHQNLLLKQK